jgi:hypothetical protein
MLIAFEVAGFPEGQAIFEVITQVTTCPFDGTNEYVGVLPPTLPPFTFHW